MEKLTTSDLLRASESEDQVIDKRDAPLIELICQDCGKPFKAKSRRALRCTDCNQAVKIQRARDSYRAHYDTNKEERREKCREWKAQNKERVKQYQREYYGRNRETLLEKKREYAKAGTRKILPIEAKRNGEN